jgi:hypothetical protein
VPLDAPPLVPPDVPPLVPPEVPPLEDVSPDDVPPVGVPRLGASPLDCEPLLDVLPSPVPSPPLLVTTGALLQAAIIAKHAPTKTCVKRGSMREV